MDAKQTLTRGKIVAFTEHFTVYPCKRHCGINHGDEVGRIDDDMTLTLIIDLHRSTQERITQLFVVTRDSIGWIDVVEQDGVNVLF